MTKKDNDNRYVRWWFVGDELRVASRKNYDGFFDVKDLPKYKSLETMAALYDHPNDYHGCEKCYFATVTEFKRLLIEDALR